MKINYSKVAQEEYFEVLYFLADKFGADTALKFENDFLGHITQLENYPESYGSFYNTDKRKFMVNKNVTVVFQINHQNKTVEILNFWYNRGNPNVFLKHL
jgi:plasmid stabilization system protein ParE